MQKFGAVAAVVAFRVLVSPWGLEASPATPSPSTSVDARSQASALLEEVQRHPTDPAALGPYAEFLDRYDSQDARAAYRKWLEALPAGSAAAQPVARRLVILDLVDGDRVAATKDLTLYGNAGGHDLTLPPEAPRTPDNERKFVEIPGPLRSFARMAAIASEPEPEEVLPAIARNVVMSGYQASRSNDVLEPTEYLKLVTRYVSQARELEKLAGAGKVIKIETCESAETGELLRIIGFRMRGGCGSDVVLETVNASRAFLTTDSGFPVSELEQALRTGQPFSFDYHPTLVPILYGADYWVAGKDKALGTFLDVLLAEPSMCRLYLGMAKLDRGTADQLKAAIPLPQLRPYANVLDFYGSMFEIRDGHAVTPGGDRSAATWGELVGVSPNNGSQFFARLLAKDDGWLASLYDSLARIHGPVQAYLTDPSRMKRFYAAVRGTLTSPGPARPVFRANADMMLLTTRLRLDPDGHPHIPGGIVVWRELFADHPRGKYDAKLARSAASWRGPDDVIEALFALSRRTVDNEPLKIFMALSDLDRYRQTPLQAGTVLELAHNYRDYGAQYRAFADCPTLADASMVQFISTMDSVNHIRDLSTRSDAAGTLQALVGLWQILCRQGSVRPADANKIFTAEIAPFGDINGERDVFVAGRNGIKLLLSSAGGSENTAPQQALLGLLVGGTDSESSDARDQMIKEMVRGLDAQRMVSLDNLFLIADNLDKAAAGQPADMTQVQKIAARITEIQLPRAPLSGAEKNALAVGYWTEKHIESQRRLNLRAGLDKAGKDPERLGSVEGSLAPLLRDTLVALNYVHYAPPGAQILYTNPLFVRGHDFFGMNSSNGVWKPTEMLGAGWPSNGGGRLIGSLCNLPYALAQSEQNFLIPTQTQALIWGDLVPQMILTARLPRWWNVTPVQLHWVNLHMRLAESTLAVASLSPELRAGVANALRDQLPPNRAYRVNHLLEAGDVKQAIESVTPVEMYVLASAMENNPALAQDPAAVESRQIRAEHAAEVSDEAISAAFGTPKPTLANSYRPELLKLRTFPTLMGYSSRIMAESWESNTLYWAALADQLHMPPGQLNVAIPVWTEKVVERIFASHLEDWPALLRSLRTVGADARSGALVARVGE